MTVDTAEKISDRVRRLRRESCLSQSELAAKAGVELSTIQRIEGAHVTPLGATLRKIAQALEVSPRDLVRGTTAAAA